MHNNDKKALLKSMNNLMKHITSSRESQQEIFASLERKDFNKIITNLADPILELRVISARLLGELLFECQNLQRQFCQLMEIPFVNDSEIILGDNFSAILQAYPSRIGQIYRLIKSHHKVRINSANVRKKHGTMLWFINPEKDNLSIEYLSREQLADIMAKSSSREVENPQDAYFDPIYCIFGILTAPADGSQGRFKQKSTQNTELSDSKDGRKCGEIVKPLYFQPYVYVAREKREFNYFSFNNNPIHNANPGIAKLNMQTISFRYGNSSNNNNSINNSINNNRTDRSPNDRQRKISWTEDRRKPSFSQQEQPSIVKFTFNQLQMKSSYRSRPETSKNQHYLTLPSSYSNQPQTLHPMSFPLDPTLTTPSKITHASTTPNTGSTMKPSPVTPHIRKQLFSHNSSNTGVVAPSMKVKNIAMNGRQGWETARNCHAVPSWPNA